MAYKIIKGWPGEHTLDYQFTPASGVTIVAGDVFCVGSTGEAIAGTYAANGADATDFHFFCFDVDTITGKVMGIPGNIIVEIDSDQYVAGSYSVSDSVTATTNKFDVISSSTKAIGKVLYKNATTGIMHILMKNN